MQHNQLSHSRCKLPVLFIVSAASQLSARYMPFWWLFYRRGKLLNARHLQAVRIPTATVIVLKLAYK